MAEPESAVLEILKKVQASISRLEARVDALMAMQDDIRMIRVRSTISLQSTSRPARSARFTTT